MISKKPELILDIAGVLITNFSQSFWRNLSEESNVLLKELLIFKNEIRKDLWTGNISEDDFWLLLKEQFPIVNIKNAQSLLLNTIKPLPAIEIIPIWSQYANIHLLSNHRSEWVYPIFKPYMDFITSITVSDQVGYCKPEPKRYEVVNSCITNSESVLYVEDQEKNLIPAKELGWRTMLADNDCKWVNQIMPMLKEMIGGDDDHDHLFD